MRQINKRISRGSFCTILEQICQPEEVCVELDHSDERQRGRVTRQWGNLDRGALVLS
jgi:hypothetical protein